MKKEAFDNLYRQYHRLVFRTIYRVLGNEVVCDELTQEVFLRAFRNFSQLEQGKEKAWLLRVASNLAIDESRKKKHQLRLQEETLHHHKHADNRDEVLKRLQIQRTFSKLKPQESKLLLLYSEGLSYDEIAEAIDVKKSSLTQLLARAKQSFRIMYEKH